MKLFLRRSEKKQKDLVVTGSMDSDHTDVPPVKSLFLARSCKKLVEKVLNYTSILLILKMHLIKSGETCCRK